MESEDTSRPGHVSQEGQVAGGGLPQAQNPQDVNNAVRRAGPIRTTLTPHTAARNVQFGSCSNWGIQVMVADKAELLQCLIIICRTPASCECPHTQSNYLP